MTREEAQKLAKTEWWKGKAPRDVALFQLAEEKLCMPFAVFHEVLEAALGRPVYTHEMAWPEYLRQELCGDKPAPSMKEILELIPEGKGIIVTVE